MTNSNVILLLLILFNVFHLYSLDIIFDSYYTLSPLEPYDDVCFEYESEDCAKRWLESANNVTIRNENRLSNIEYRYSTNINHINLKLKTKLQKSAIKLGQIFQKKAQKFQWQTFQCPLVRRMFKKLTASTQSKNDSITSKIIQIKNKISFIYNNGKPCHNVCLAAGETEIIDVFRREKDYDKLLGFWASWRNVTGSKIRNLFIKKMQLENKAARENGYENEAWFIFLNDFEDKTFKETIIKLYDNILPLYKELHGYVRYCLAKYYPYRFDKNGPIPAHILGDLWAQKWSNILPILKLCNKDSYKKTMQQEINDNLQKLSVKKMFKLAENFYKSIGMYKMTNEFWERSVFKKAHDKLVNCHGSAHDFSNGRDFRIIMCTQKNFGDFTTIHHEMGHVQYFMAYKNLNIFLRGSANSAFHEAIGDTIALSVKTPEHLHKIGLISNIPKSDSFDIDYLMATALEKVVFLPFALTMESFIWDVYNDSVPLSKLNEHWWDLKNKYQGLKSPIERSEKDFDAGAKYHIAFGVPYIRYFISYVVQFQFYESMCHISGYKGPLHRCDFYKSKKAGRKLLKMLKLGQSKPWRKALKILTGAENIQSDALLKFFQPLYKWLKEKNEKLKIKVGW